MAVIINKILKTTNTRNDELEMLQDLIKCEHYFLTPCQICSEGSLILGGTAIRKI